MILYLASIAKNLREKRATTENYKYKYVLGLGHPLSDRTIRDRAKLKVLKPWEILMPTNNFF